MRATMTPSTATSMAYSARTKLGFRILLWLHENRLIDEKKVPEDAIKMICSWNDMKKGRKHHPTTIKGSLVSLLDNIPASNSKEICRDNVVKNIEENGKQLLIDGYIVIYPVSHEDGWSYKRTLAGDQLLRVSGYS